VTGIRDRDGKLALVDNQDVERLLVDDTGRIVTPSWDSNGGSLPSMGVAPSGDTSGAMDLAAIQAAHDALPSTGGSIQLGTGAFYLNGALSFTKQVALRGWGGQFTGDASANPPRAITTIYVTTGNTDGITSAAHGCLFADFALVNTSGTTPTAGTGLNLTASSQAALSRVSVVGFYNNVQTNGVYFTIDSCHLWDAVNYCLYLNNTTAGYLDHGDLGIHNCDFGGFYKTWNPVAAIRWEGGGGLRIIGNKINGGIQPGNSSAGKCQVGIDLMAADGVSTGDLTIVGNSIANFSVSGIRIGLKGPSNTGGFINVSITGNQINVGSGSAVGITLGTPTSATLNQIRSVDITGNVFYNLPGSSIVAQNMTSLQVGMNNHDTIGSPIILLGTNGSFTGGLTGVTILPQQTQADAIDLIQDWRSQNNTNRNLDGRIQHEYRRHAHITAANVWQTQFVLTPWSTGGTGSAGRIKFTVSGTNGATGGFAGVYDRLWSITNNLATPTFVVVGTDTTAGAGQFAVQFVASANTITIQVQIITAATVTTGDLVCDLEIQGLVRTVHKGA
jgi:hypothetical protein